MSEVRGHGEPAYTADDLITYARWITRPRWTHMLGFAAFLASALAALALILLWQDKPTYFRVVLPLLMGWSLFRVGQTLWVWLNRAGRTYANQAATTGEARGPARTRFGRRGVAVQTLHGARLIPWHTMTGWADLGPVLLLVPNDGIHLPLPTRWFKSPGDARTAVRHHLGPPTL
jgi:hypothetical protein